MSEAELPRSKRGVGRLPRKNVYYAVARGRGIYRTPHAVAFVRALRAAALRQGVSPIRSGWWALELLVMAPGRLRSLDVLVPRCDSDACLAPVRDALQYAELLDDDARIVSDRTWICRGAPALTIRLSPVEAPDELLAAAWPHARYFGG